MKKVRVLTAVQEDFLGLFAKQKFSEKFYFTGGTVLAAFYIPYRLSEDLDFFSKDEIKTEGIIVFLRSIKDKLKFVSFDFNTSFNRNLFFIKFKKGVLKLEFTYYPFKQIKTPKKIGGIKIDSVRDIAVNKLFTIYQKPRSRDFMDLFMICKKYHFSIYDLVRDAKLKFDWHVDPLKLGVQFLFTKQLKDYPKLIETLDESEWQNFFEEEAKKLKIKIMKN